jgi:predicted pyridoxine 5'-phosphate oxidase superfamily flavin-nucleotide-binding protein
MSHKFFDLTFSQSVKKTQEHFGSRRNFERFETGEPDFTGLAEEEIDYIQERDSFYIATVGETGQPYVQFRGGPAGFLKALDSKTLAYADFRGNLQYISSGNLAANDRAALILMDYPNQRRLKILARTEVKDAAAVPDLIEKIKMPNYRAKIERAVVFHVEAFDWNCPQHITPRYTADEVRAISRPLHARIEQLESEIRELRGKKGG